MRRRRRRLPLRTLGLFLLLSAVLYSLTPAFAAQTGRAGFSAPDGGDYRATNVRYDLDGSRVAGVSFRLNAPARTVQASLGGGGWTQCTVAGTTARCRFAAEPSVAAVTSLSFLAA